LADLRTAGVIGAGPAGLIAAEVLSAAGVAVTVFEHRRSPANKFVLAGRGGLNITNSEPLDQFLDRYGPDRSFVEPAIRAWPPDRVQAWIADLGEPAFVGSSGRVFPASMRAVPLLRAWLARLAAAGVSLETSTRWVGFGEGDNRSPVATGGIAQSFVSVGEGASEARRTEVRDVWLFALGGASWPRVGADGSWFTTFEEAGIEVVPIEPSNCGACVQWTPLMLERFEGAPIKNVAVSARHRGSPNRGWVRGDLIITREGLEGGPVYAQSRSLRQQARAGDEGQLLLDLQPDLTVDAVQERLRQRRSGATVTSWLRGAGLSPVKIALLREATDNKLSNDAGAMASLIKSCEISVTSLAPVDRAISTAGGVTQSAVDERFMLRRRPGVFVAGEMLDWDAPTGGYLLQACLSMGVAAATGMTDFVATR